MRSADDWTRKLFFFSAVFFCWSALLSFFPIAAALHINMAEKFVAHWLPAKHNVRTHKRATHTRRCGSDGRTEPRPRRVDAVPCCSTDQPFACSSCQIAVACLHLTCARCACTYTPPSAPLAPLAPGASACDRDVRFVRGRVRSDQDRHGQPQARQGRQARGSEDRCKMENSGAGEGERQRERAERIARLGAAEAADASAARPVGADSAFAGSRRASHSPASLRHARLRWTPFDASDADSRAPPGFCDNERALNRQSLPDFVCPFFFFFFCCLCFSAVVAVTPVASASGYQEPTAENIGQWLENPANIAAWEKSLA